MTGAFTRRERANPPWHTVAYNTPGTRPVPIYRALALALDHAHDHGARFALMSADRRDRVLAAFNRAHGTNLHGQQYLFDHQGGPGFFPANPPDETSHCLRSDGNAAYRVRGHVIAPRGRLPRYMLGIDAVDDGSANDCSHLIATLERLGYHVTRPYHTGSEAHHFIFVGDPVPVLVHAHRIPPR